MENSIVEYADFYRMEQRIVNAANSLQSWYSKRHRELVEQDCKLGLAAARENDAGKRIELDRKRQQIKEKIDRLNSGMRACRLANLGANSEKASIPSSTEQRLQMKVTPAPARISPINDAEPPSVQRKLNGLAAVYDKEANIGGYFIEEIYDGAFLKVLSTKPDVRFLQNHDPNFLYSRTTNKSLRLYNISHTGLAFWADLLPDDPASDALFARIQRGDISGCSFAFTIAEDDWILPERLGELPKRTIIKIGELFDVGPVVYPAYTETNIIAVAERQKTAEEIFEEYEQEEFEEWDRIYRFKKIENDLRNSRMTYLLSRLKK